MVESKVSPGSQNDVSSEAPDGVEPGGPSVHRTRSLRRHLQHERIGELLAQIEKESGPVPRELVAEAKQIWRRPQTGSASRHNA